MKRATLDTVIATRVAPRLKRAFINKAVADGGVSEVMRLLIEQYVNGNLKVVPSTIKEK